MTFDDGPNKGPSHVLDALKEVRVRATFFINSINLQGESSKVVARNQESLARMVAEGHVLGDHSYDHMFHNTVPDTARNAYVFLHSDIAWFGQRNINPAMLTLKEVGFKEDDVNFVADTMWNNVRLPFSNKWRVGPVQANCFPCTVPASSRNNGVELAKALTEEGASVFGWDLEWQMNFHVSRYRYGGQALFSRLDARGWGNKLQGKSVVLTHGIAHRPGGNLNSKNELVVFLKMAMKEG